MPFNTQTGTTVVANGEVREQAVTAIFKRLMLRVKDAGCKVHD